jgi:hypothetical protein
VGYKRLDSKVVPVFRRTPQELQYYLTSRGLQGILSYARNYGISYRLHSNKCERLIEHVKDDIRQWISHPPKRDMEPLKDLFFTDDWPIETNRRLIEQINLRDIVTIVGLHRKVAKSWWPKATLTVAPASSFTCLLYLATFYIVRALGQVKSVSHLA